MDLEPAERDVDTSMSRRRLVTLTGAAGLGGLAASLLVDRAALAAPDDEGEQRPNVPTEADMAILRQVIGFELAASALYQAKLGTDAEGREEPGEGEESDPLTVAVRVMAENHQAFAQAAAGDTGMSADEGDPDIIAANLVGFTGSNSDFFTTAHALEQTTVATHTALIGDYESASAIKLTASIAITEARHASVLADLLDVEDLDVLFGNDESALLLGSDA